MKIAVTGKGGVGKTTLAASLSHVYAAGGRRVVAVDADPDANLASAFGIGKEEIARIKPIAEMSELIEERTGARPGASGGMFKLNPKVDDIPTEYGYRFDNIVMLITGRSKEAATGCYCPENVLLRRLLKHLIVEREEVVIVDMEAGIEHLTRGTAEAVDAFIVVVEPGSRSIQTAHMVKEMAKGLGVKKVFVVANKIRDASDLAFIRQQTGDMLYAGSISHDPRILEADMEGKAPYELSATLLKETTAIKEEIERLIK